MTELMASFLLMSLQSVDRVQMLLDGGIKSAMILLVTAALCLLLRRAPAAARHLVWTLAMAGLLTLPFLTMILPDWRTPLPPLLIHPSGKSSTVAEISTIEDATTEPGVLSSAGSIKELSPVPEESARQKISAAEALMIWSSANWAQIILLVWLVGAMVVLIRTALGMIKVKGIIRVSAYVIDYSWGAMVKRLAGRLQLTEHVALRKSEYVAVPMTWGVFNPVVLLPQDADEWSAELRQVVLLHEMAHIKRRDCLTQLLAQFVCALYWFNPLVWVAARRLRVERELACDDYVLEVGTRASDYASCLVEIAKVAGINGLTPPVAVGMACSQLEGRVRAILNPTIRRSSLTMRATLFLAIGMAGLIFPLAAAQLWGGVAAEEQKGETSVPSERHHAEAVETDRSETPQKETHKDPVKQDEKAIDEQEQDDSNIESVESNEDDQDRSDGEGSGQGTGQGTGQGSGSGSGLTAEKIIEMKMHGVTPEFIESMRKLGYDGLTAKELVDLRIHGVTEEYIKESQNLSNEKLTVKELVQLRISGVNPEYVREMKKAGYDLPVKSLSKMHMFGVTPGFIETMRKLGYTNLTAEQLTGLKIHGVNESYVKEMRDAGYDKLTADELKRMRIHSVTGAYVKEMRDLGFDKLTTDEVIKMRIHGVTADYVRKLRAAGLKNVSTGQLLQMKIRGIDQILLKN